MIFIRSMLPPQKTVALSHPSKIKNPYSQIKIRENKPPPYSTLKPETSSDSPSAKSNGLRFLSAKQTNNQQKNKWRTKNMNQKLNCKKRNLFKSNSPSMNTNESTNKTNLTS